MSRMLNLMHADDLLVDTPGLAKYHSSGVFLKGPTILLLFRSATPFGWKMTLREISVSDTSHWKEFADDSPEARSLLYAFGEDD